MVKYTSTFGLKAGSDKEKSWKLWQEIHVPKVIELLNSLISKYIILRVENADRGGKPELYGGIELWFKDWKCAEEGVNRMLGHNPDAIDEFSKLVVDLRRTFVIEEKVVYESK